MSSVTLIVVSKAVVLAIAAYFLGQVIIGVNLGAKFWKDAEGEEQNVPHNMRFASSIFRGTVFLLSAVAVVGFGWFAAWWIGWMGEGGAF